MLLYIVNVDKLRCALTGSGTQKTMKFQLAQGATCHAQECVLQKLDEKNNRIKKNHSELEHQVYF